MHISPLLWLLIKFCGFFFFFMEKNKFQNISFMNPCQNQEQFGPWRWQTVPLQAAGKLRQRMQYFWWRLHLIATFLGPGFQAECRPPPSPGCLWFSKLPLSPLQACQYHNSPSIDPHQQRSGSISSPLLTAYTECLLDDRHVGIY